ncbi:MAG: [FeFe] hydrogenase H-cluster radical SAM maturase HydE [Desulfovibrionaceae bacterium]|nr:[FeFe] hydrogenase H-cluster radical SAM maturase HydE [Desulfovibrionaceae bacterium]
MRRSDIMKLLFETPYEELREQADEVRCKAKGDHVFVRGLIEFSNRCERNCRYCGLRAANTELERYDLDDEQIEAAADRAVALGADTLVLQSGEVTGDPGRIARMVDRLSRRHHVPITLSVGEHPTSSYALWREAGATRFLIKHETADAGLYAKLHPGWTLAQRVDALRRLRALGYEIGSGFIVGVPGQTPEILAEDILLCRDLHVDMCGAGPFIPQKNTPLGTEPRGTAELTLRVMAVLRIAMPWANLPATTALATLNPVAGQREGLRAGGNVLMPGFTPAAFRRNYCIYDNKHRVDMEEARLVIESAGRTHSLRV